MTDFPAIWVDGERSGALPLPDRGLDFGDGLFETLLLRQGRPTLLAYHLQRLQTGLHTLGFPECDDALQAQLRIACGALEHLPWAALRLAITRGAGPRGYAPPEQCQPRIIITAAPLASDRLVMPDPITLDWANIRWSCQPALAGLKHMNRIEQVLAAAEARKKGVDDVVVLGQEGNACSVSAGNLFAMIDGVLHTPALETSGIAGTRRRLVMEQIAPAMGLEVVEGPILPRELQMADEVFCCNSIKGIQPVKALAERHWDSFPCSRAIHSQYREHIA